MGNSPAPTPCRSWGLGAVGRWGEKTTNNQQPTTNNQQPTTNNQQLTTNN
ncbi:hypothetical protein [Fischerella sp. FACHB-380]|nr:hypothetical protein [Fischerella sp. FACHB-380]